MVGFITDRDLEQADEAFPGILRLYDSLASKPRTFLELVALFERLEASPPTAESRASRPARAAA